MKLFALVFIFVCNHITVAAQNKSLPEFSFSNNRNQKITPASLPIGQPVVVFYFDPFCDHCKEQAKIVGQDAAKFGKTTFVWVGLGEMEDNVTFKKEHLKLFLKHLYVKILSISLIVGLDIQKYPLFLFIIKNESLLPSLI